MSHRYYDNTNTLRFCLAHTLRVDYGLSPADFKGLFQIDALEHWLRSGLSADAILLQTVGQPTQQKKMA